MATLLFGKWPQLEKWVGRADLAWLRLEALDRSSRKDGVVPAVAAGLARWEQRLLDLAAFFDPFEAAPVDDLFLEVFRYGYLRGLAHATHDRGVAERILAVQYLETFPDLVKRFARDMERLRLPCPSTDRLAIEHLAGHLS